MFHTAPEDFIAEEKQVTFLANANITCTTFTIINESFEILFTVPAGVIPPSTNPLVTIIDDESELIVFSILFNDYNKYNNY